MIVIFYYYYEWYSYVKSRDIATNPKENIFISVKSIKLTTTYILTQNPTSVNKIKRNKKIATQSFVS